MSAPRRRYGWPRDKRDKFAIGDHVRWTGLGSLLEGYVVKGPYIGEMDPAPFSSGVSPRHAGKVCYSMGVDPNAPALWYGHEDELKLVA
jgi:hypothetical protein